PIIQGAWRVGTFYVPGVSSWYGEEDWRQAQYAWFLIIATIPAVIAGLLFEESIETYLRSPLSIALALIGGGILLLLADICSRKRSLEQLDGKQSFFVGCFQALALIPGFSRSGSAIT
ncbi:MAG: undecaprenyl-diphosphate phosphatase, partial [Candidatus Paceibacteria bacterium]